MTLTWIRLKTSRKSKRTKIFSSIRTHNSNHHISILLRTLSFSKRKINRTRKSIKMYSSTIFVSFAFISLALAAAPPTCGTCNPLSGQNHCDITTSCINTGTRFHCACRAGYKASTDNDDIDAQFRLNVPNYTFLVFTPGNTVCNTLCDNPYGAGPDLCSEVPIYKFCPV
jgi:hypothetical protein